MSSIKINSDNKILDYRRTMKMIDDFVKSNYKYEAKRFIRGYERTDPGYYETIAFGKDKDELAKYCESIELRKSTILFDGGYIIKEIEK